MTGQFTPDQVERLLRPIKPNRVYQSQGQSNVAAWEIRAHLTRLFGFGGWSKRLLRLELLVEDSKTTGEGDKARTGWWVTYGCDLSLTVKDPDGEVAFYTEDSATGSASNQPSRGDAHDLARKNAVSYALKRCAIDLGDQFGLSLYQKGLTTAVVGMTLVGTKEGRKDDTAEPEHTVDGEDYDPDDPGRPM